MCCCCVWCWFFLFVVVVDFFFFSFPKVRKYDSWTEIVGLHLELFCNCQKISPNKNVFGIILAFEMFQRKLNQALGELLDVDIVAGNVLVARKGKVWEEAVEYPDVGL